MCVTIITYRADQCMITGQSGQWYRGYSAVPSMGSFPACVLFYPALQGGTFASCSDHTVSGKILFALNNVFCLSIHV